ncbi:MAG: hypothetical protein ACK6BG_07765 [Cyanobacteriota bacterium]
MSVLQALKELVDTLVQAIEPSRFDDLLADMQEVKIGTSIVKEVKGGSHESRCKQLVQNSAKQGEAGFDVLWEVLNINVDPSLAIRPRLEKAFAAYRDAKRREAQSCQPRLSSCLEDQVREGKILRGRLDDLARKHSRVEPAKLQRAVASALRESYQGQLPVNMVPSIFDSGPITDWSDLRRRTARDPFPLDQRFLDALEAALTNPSPEDGSGHALALASLIVMVLEPTDLTEGESCKEYAFRAFLCPGENATPAQWISLDAKDPGYPIPAKGFVEGLQALLCQALERALVQVPSTSEPLLLEIFLPAEYLNLDIGSEIRLPVPGEPEKSGPIARDYPMVLRSSDRYQRFHERRAKTHQTPLPAKWDWAKSATTPAEARCRWWQDPPPTSKQGPGSLTAEKNGSTTEDRMDALRELFANLRAYNEFFSFRRITNLPTCPQTLQTWLNQVINACPAVAIWWRPGAQSSDAQREESLRFWQEESRRGSAVVKSSEKQLVAKKKLAHNDPFFHPHVTTPLKLFHALASAIFLGRHSDDHSLAFKEVVLLMDSVERWPPRRDFEPLFERKSVQGVTVVNVSDEGLLRVSDLPP